MSHDKARWILPVLVAVLILAPGPALARVCDVEVAPAATLLLPYFEVGAPGTTNTIFAIVNSTLQSRIAHVTLWTDWAIPTVSFDIRLSGYDVQSVNVIDIFTGATPETATAAGCTGALAPGTLHFNPVFRVTGNLDADLEMLWKAHTGATVKSAAGADVVASSQHAEAKGYITIDVVRTCTALFPSSPGYFKDRGTGIATNDNALSGDFFLADLALGIAVGDALIHVRADAAFGNGDYTFYGRYVGGSAIDDRQPLGSVYGSRQFTLFPPDPAVSPATNLFVWRDTKSLAAAPVAVGSRPAWYPLGLKIILSCDEAENCSNVRGALPLATQRVGVNVPGGIPAGPGSGWMRINLNHGTRTSLFGASAQGWAVTAMAAALPGGLAAAMYRSVRLQTPCKP